MPPDATEENIQARARGILLMAISNKLGKMLLSTGNKSEMAVGYATLYGDMAGGFAPLKDCSKTLVYQLANYRNGIAPVIPERVISRAPTAELRHDQKDSDSLPPYDVLDAILEAFIEKDYSVGQITELGFDRADRRARSADGQARGVQTPSGAAGRARQQSRFRPRLALPDHVGLLKPGPSFGHAASERLTPLQLRGGLCGGTVAEALRKHATRVGREVRHAERTRRPRS